MYRKPELMMFDVPVASPYYDRLRALKLQVSEEPYGSPEYNYLNRQISELSSRARKRMLADSRLGM